MSSKDCATRATRATRDRVAAAIGTAAVGALTAFTLLGHHTVLDWVIAVLSLGLTPVAMFRPLGGGLAANLLAALSPAATPLASASALYAGRFRRFPQAAAVAVAGVGAHAIQGWWRPVTGASYGFWLLLIAVAYAALVGWGAWLQARHSLLMSLRDRARRAEAEQARRVGEARLAERTRIAREMHDVLAHRLSLVATYAGALEYRPDSSPEQLSAAAGVVRAGVHQALEELRAVIGVLRAEETGGSAGETDGTRPQPVLADLGALIGESRAAGVAVTLREEVTGTPPELVGRTAYRVVQEALTNARKHAAGQPVTVVVTGAAGGALTVEVTNPFSGNASGLPGSGTGLIGLAERVRLAGGTLDTGTLDTGGSGAAFRLRARLPWPV